MKPVWGNKEIVSYVQFCGNDPTGRITAQTTHNLQANLSMIKYLLAPDEYTEEQNKIMRYKLGILVKRANTLYF